MPRWAEMALDIAANPVLYAVAAIVLGIFIGMVLVIVCAVLDDNPTGGGLRYRIPDPSHDDQAEGRGGDLPEIVAPRRRHMPEVGLAREL